MSLELLLSLGSELRKFIVLNCFSSIALLLGQFLLSVYSLVSNFLFAALTIRFFNFFFIRIGIFVGIDIINISSSDTLSSHFNLVLERVFELFLDFSGLFDDYLFQVLLVISSTGVKTLATFGKDQNFNSGHSGGGEFLEIPLFVSLDCHLFHNHCRSLSTPEIHELFLIVVSCFRVTMGLLLGQLF